MRTGDADQPICVESERIGRTLKSGRAVFLKLGPPRRFRSPGHSCREGGRWRGLRQTFIQRLQVGRKEESVTANDFTIE